MTTQHFGTRRTNTLAKYVRAAIYAMVVAEMPIVASAGDFNGDGFDDLAIGIISEDVGEVGFDAGVVNVLLGSPSGPIVTGDQVWGQNSPGVKEQADCNYGPGYALFCDFFGGSLTAGDFNGDGFDDLAVGTDGENAQSGVVQVLFGSSASLQASDPNDQLWSQDSPDVPGDGLSRDKFGDSLTACDFDRDSFDDLAITVPGDALPSGGSEFHGSVNVLRGSGEGLTAVGSQLWNQDSPDVQERQEEGDAFGVAVTCRDFNGDGFDDLAVGATGEDIDRIANVGVVHVIFGSEAGLQATGAGAPDDQLWSQDSPGVPGSPDEDDTFGHELAACDFDADGWDDLAISVAEGTRDVERAGAVHVLYGSDTGLRPLRNQLWSQDSPGVADTAESNDEFGKSLSCADFNGDGFDDLVVGIPNEDHNAVDSGAVEILYGSPVGVQAACPCGRPDQFLTQDSPGIRNSENEGDLFGNALHAADFNDDGFADLAIGAEAEDIGNISNAGAAHVLFGGPNGLRVSGNQLWHQGSPGVLGTPEQNDSFGFSLEHH